MILPRARAKAGPAEMVRITMEESITAGKVANKPAQNALPVAPTTTAEPTTVPANTARMITFMVEYFFPVRGMEGMRITFSAIQNVLTATTKYSMVQLMRPTP
jgi:hypothetical protein